MKEIVTEASRSPARRIAAAALALLAYSGLTAALYRGLVATPAPAAPPLQISPGAAPPRRDIALKDGLFWVGGAPLFVNAVGWDPARPGELPWTRAVDLREVAADFERIRAAGFNAVRTWAPMKPEELALAARAGLLVLQGIWTPPDADFRDPVLRRRVLAEAARAVETSRWSPAVLVYLVMNEPRAHAVAHAGVSETNAFLREVVATVRALDPGAPIGFANWPGAEVVDDDLLDFTAFNLYPHRPRAAMDGLGVRAYTRLLRETVARGRPLLVSEFGISVSPSSVSGRGGATEEEQASGLCELASAFAAAGAAGTALFQWNDGWWKNADGPGDEQTHDPADPEEWYGLLSFSGPGDRLGTPRPALAAFKRHARAVVVEPRDAAMAAPALPVRISAEDAVEVTARLDGEPVPLVLQRRGQWLEGALALPDPGAHKLTLALAGPGGEALRREERSLRAAGAAPARLLLTPPLQRAAPGARVRVALWLAARPGSLVRAAAFSEDRDDEEVHTTRLDEEGRATLEFRAPESETMLTVVAFEVGRSESERAAGWASIEVHAP
jgi:hypothetical protein